MATYKDAAKNIYVSQARLWESFFVYTSNKWLPEFEILI
jgi:hypothetical protein